MAMVQRQGSNSWNQMMTTGPTWQTLTGTIPNVSIFPNNAGYLTNLTGFKLNQTSPQTLTCDADTYIKNSVWSADLSAIVPDLVLTLPVWYGVGHSTLPDILPFPYAMGVYDRFAIIDKSDFDEPQLLFAKDDFSNSASIIADMVNGRFLANWDWCPEEDDLYSIGASDKRWKNGYFSGVVDMDGGWTAPVPHLMQSDNTDQSISSATAEQVITFDTDVHHSGITRTSSSRFTITKAGSYLITFSAVVSSTLPGKVMAMWLKVNGNNVSNSSTYYTFKGAGANTVVSVPFIEHFAVNDYFEFWWWGNDTGIKLDYTAAVAANTGVTPAIPACPSIIMTAQYIGAD